MKNLKYYFQKIKLLLKYRNNYERTRAIDKYLRYIKFADVKGDYYEFGVYAGETFRYVYHSAQLREQSNLHFFAFHSFEGFSPVSDADNTGVLSQGGRSFPLNEFMKRIEKEKINLDKISVIPGWLDDTLQGSKKKETEEVVGNSKVAIAYLDVDLYEPTKVALDYIKDKLSDGALLCFDNWFLLKGHPERGEIKAFAEWQKENPDIIVTPYDQFGWHGKTYIVSHNK